MLKTSILRYMSYDREGRPERGRGHKHHGHHQHSGPKEHHGAHHGRGRHGLHSGRKVSSGDLSLLLLLLLSKQPAHGYELIKTFEERTDGFYVPSPGMVYPALTYLEELGFASVETEGAKKRYFLSGEGAAHLEANRQGAEGLLAELERIGAQMAEARRAFAQGEGEWQENEELEAARRELKRTLREREPFSSEDASRVATILRGAASQIRGEAA